MKNKISSKAPNAEKIAASFEAEAKRLQGIADILRGTTKS
jgi:hypothetical protein